jgi:hypothetical protein
VYSRLYNVYISISILVFTLTSPCLIIDEIATTIGYESYIRLGLMLNLVILALISYDNSHVTKLQKSLIYLFGVLIIYFIILGSTVYIGSGYTTKTPIKNYGITILIILIINSSRYDVSKLVKVFMGIAFTLALLSIIQYVLFFFDLHTPSSYILKTYSPGDHRYIGFGGFIDPDYLSGNTYRVESFWREPSRFAQYLQVPLFIAIYSYIMKKNRANLLYLLVIALALFLTFSVANYFSILIAVILYFAVGKKSELRKYRLLKYIRNILAIPILIIILLAFFKVTDEGGNIGTKTIFQKKTTAQLIKRIDRMDIASSVLEISIFGDPEIRNNWKSNPSAIGMIIIWGGIPALILSLIYSALFFRVVLNQIRNSVYGMIYLGSISFFIAFNWYGSYFDNYFLFLLAMYSQFEKDESSGRQFI